MAWDWKGYRDSAEGLATFDLLSVQSLRRLKARSRMESRTILCYLGVTEVKSINLSWSGVTDERAAVIKIATVMKFRPWVGVGVGVWVYCAFVSFSIFIFSLTINNIKITMNKTKESNGPLPWNSLLLTLTCGLLHRSHLPSFLSGLSWVLQINFTMQVGKYSSLKLLLIQVFVIYLCSAEGKQWNSCYFKLTIKDL